MRFISLIFCGLALTLNCAGQSLEDLSQASFNSRFNQFISSLEAKGGSNFKLTKHLFTKAHRDFLKSYRAYSQVNDIFRNGNYDCLSGTYFLASALDRLGIPFKIYETNYHIFLTVQTNRGEILMESTDRDNGLIINRDLIKEKISKYQQTKTSSVGELYLSRVRMFHELQSTQLPGLLYFNQAVEAFNKNELIACCTYLEQAWKIYDNPRIEVFTPILLRTIQASSLDESSKERLTQLLRTHQQTSVNTLAAR